MDKRTVRLLPLLALLALSLVTGCGRSQAGSDPTPPAAAPAPLEIPSTVDAAEAALENGREEIYELALARIAREGSGREQTKAAVALAQYFDDERRHEEAVAGWHHAEKLLPRVAPFIRLHRIDALRRAGKAEEALALADSIIADSRQTTASTFARIERAALLAELRSDGAAEAIKALESIPVDEFTETELAEAATRIDEAGFRAAAGNLRLHLLRKYPGGRNVESLYRAADESISKLSFETALELAERLGRANRYDQSLELFDRLQKRFPAEARSQNFRYLRTVARFNSRRYDEVVAESFNRSEPYYLAGELLRAHAFWRTDRPNEFIDIARRIIKEAPSSPEATRAGILLGKYHAVDRFDYVTAAQYLRKAVDAGALGNDGDNLWTLGWIETLAGNDEKALATFSRYLDRYPDADYTSNALFWSGKIHARRGETARRDAAFRKLVDLYPYSYYSYRARALTGWELPADPSAGEPVELPAVPADHPLAEELVLIDELFEAGLRREAARELKRTAAGTTDRLIALRLADVYSAAGEPLKAIGILNRHFSKEIRRGLPMPRRFWEILYPRLHWDAIVDGAGRAKLDPYLVSSIIRQESGFEPTIVSSAGAVGLMQLMPKEAPSIAAAAGLPDVTRDQLFDPAINVRLGAAEFRQKLGRMKDDRSLAVAAYNAGEEAVRRWLAKYPADDIDFFIESIPYNETRLYVKIVNRNYQEYRRLYASGSAKPASEGAAARN